MTSFLIRVILTGALITPLCSFSMATDSSDASKIIATTQSKRLSARIDEISFRFFSLPYLKYPLGEGSADRFDQNPKFRFDGFDCTTYIETVLALAWSQNSDEFESFMDKIRYADGSVSFESRNHFTDLDWIPNNSRVGLISDITRALFAEQTRVAKAIIDKPNWYKMLTSDRIHNSESDTQNLLLDLKNLGSNFSAVESRINFVPISDLVEQPWLLDRIPNGSIVNFVRANWNLKKFIGTNMNVSHQGFAIRKKDGVLYFRHASSELKKVSEEPLISYLQRALTIKSISGINILKAQDPR